MHPRATEAVLSVTFSASTAAARQRIASRMLQVVGSERHRRQRMSSDAGVARRQCWLLKGRLACSVCHSD
jgi:hypothetical protein